MKPRTILSRGLLIALLILGAWFGLMFATLVRYPWVAIQASTTDAFRIPESFASAFIRWGPYDPNSNTGLSSQPLLNFACAGYGLTGTDREASIRVVRALHARGANIDSRYNGMTTLHEAILYSSPDGDTGLIQTLLELGADPDLKIERPGTPVDGLTAVEFAELLARKHPKEMRSVIDLLRTFPSNYSFKATSLRDAP